MDISEPNFEIAMVGSNGSFKDASNGASRCKLAARTLPKTRNKIKNQSKIKHEIYKYLNFPRFLGSTTHKSSINRSCDFKVEFYLVVLGEKNKYLKQLPFFYLR